MSKTTKTKQGAASLYVVIFTTLLLGIITLGFIRIMLSETIQTGNADLSQSAYDSALAGVEDAKVALLKYHDCLSSGSDSAACQAAIAAMRDPNATTNCDIVPEALGNSRNGENETIIESSTDGTGSEMEQAYTCVLISENTGDYLGQLNDSFHSKIVPLRVSNVNDINYIRLDWYSATNASNRTPNTADSSSTLKPSNKPNDYNDTSNSGLFGANSTTDTIAPPTIGVQLFQTNKTFRLSELDLNNGDNTNHGSLLLVPANGGATSPISSNSSIGFSASVDKAINTPIPIQCSPNDDTEAAYFCSATLQVPAPYNGGERSDGSAFLRLFLPYGTPDTDFSVRLCRNSSCGDSDILPFVGVQARIDSTGRANTLFRRIETRVELVDVYFPFPEYTASVTGGKSDDISKNFWVTKNNWGGQDSGQIN